MKRGINGQSAKKPKKPRSEDDIRDPIQVFCRVRPAPTTIESPCIKVVSDTDLQIHCLPDDRGISREGQFSYKKIFTEYETQDVVFQELALPLIEQLLMGKSSLLFAYGISGSGKSYTMTGNQEDGGIVGRCFDVIFNSIQDYQARRFTFKPDKLNSYDVLSIEDAMLFKAEDFKNNVKFPKTPKKKDGESDRVSFDYKIVDIEQDVAYSVFISYVEIYHNYVYDLLENVSDGEIRRNSKIIREDSNGNMYVHGVNEQEVNSADEAFDWLRKGQLRKRTAPTFLNIDSSRSHTVFTLRLVQAPLDADGVNVIQDKKFTVVSQLSLVDLAGSERAGKAKTTGQRLQEAGEINKSLSNLKQCLKILYENQSSSNLRSIAEKIPYRTSRLTHLFKSFFEGSGSIRMLICVNPMTEYAELLPVLQFGEMSGSVQVKRMTPLRMDLGLTPGRRKMIDVQTINRIPCVLEEDFKDPNDNKNCNEIRDKYFPNFLDLGPPLPELKFEDLLVKDKREQMLIALEQRIKKKDELREILINQSNDIRSNIVLLESNYKNAAQEISSLQILRDQDKNKIKQYQNKAFLLENEMASFKRKFELMESENKRLKADLNAKDNMLNQVSVDKDLLKQKYNTKIIKKQEQLSKDFKDKWRVQENEFEAKLQEKKRKLRHIKNIADSVESIPRLSSRHTIKRTLSDESLSKPDTAVNKPTENTPSKPSQATLRYLRSRRSKSCDPQERWIEHKPPVPIPLQTVMQPTMKKRKSVTKLTDAKTVSKTDASKYCLLTQEQDENGIPEAKLYKGDIIQTTGGGAQVVFNDVETLKQDSPLGGSPVKNRIQAYNEEIKAHASDDLQSRCYGIHGYTPVSRK
ncbi:kinesin-like protein KIF23 [Daktulosphaira vitifoliae]|uniref:kinesin-like protein KIF23 n=1 Tax=Daktulosphaira vitifoliae TaxID=58002 RepID=UPI0021A9B0D0|nr:kinesin-like protein KIF23 [Daktulosphaira vitifoliae]XP_050525570.1 kinesin-like protein KIF23 [Daktulosphaira vitifoliae]